MKKQTIKKPVSKKVAANSSLDVLRDFSSNLKKAVEGTGLSPYALAKNIGLDKMAIKSAMREGCDPKLSTVVRIANGMRLSMDALLGKINKVDKPEPVPEVKIKKEYTKFIDRVSKMREQDVELLDAIAAILDERRRRAVAKLLHAVQNEKSQDKSKSKDLSEKQKNKIPPKQAEDDVFDDDDIEDFFDDDYSDDDEYEIDDDYEDVDEDFDFEDDDDDY